MDIFNQITENRAHGKSFVLATIIKTSGHTPRDVGAKMLVYPDESISGTIGGGKFEKLVIEDCMQLFTDSSNHVIKHYSFEESGPDSTGMLCGGDAQVFFELFAKPKTLMIFGAGHLCQSLVEVVKGLNLRITVVDTRPEFLKNYQRPIETILTDEDYDDNFPLLDSNCYVVIVTHGHKYDKQILSKVIKEDCAYIGMIGSRKKVNQIYSTLENEGIDKSLFKKVDAPIGLAIGAEGPYEIAVAIVAEIISVQRKRLKK